MHDARGRCGSMCVCVCVFTTSFCMWIYLRAVVSVRRGCVCVRVSEVKSTLDWLVVCGQIPYLLVCIGT